MSFPKTIRAIIGTSMLLGLTSVHAAPIFTENFNSYSNGHFNGGQYQSGLSVAYGGSEPLWDRISGGNAVHVVNLATFSNPSSPDYAVMIWREDSIKLKSAIAGSNVAGQTYSVDFLASAAVYQAPSQQTSASEGLLVKVLQGNGSVLQSFTYKPGAWTGNMQFSQAHFEYTGNGSGDIKIQISSAYPDVYRFGGAIDNLSVAAVPEPETYAMFLAGLGLMGAVARRRKHQ